MSNMNVKGHDFEVELEGLRLRTVVNGRQVYARDADELRVQVAKQLQAQRVDHAIPVVVQLGGEYKRAILRGQNTRTSAALLTIDGEKMQIDRPSVVAKGEQLTNEEITELNRLNAVIREANNAHSKYFGAIRKRTTGSIYGGNLSVETLLREAASADEPEAAKA